MGHFKINVNHVNPFIMAAMHTFSTMLTVKLDPEKPVLKHHAGDLQDISGIVGLSGKVVGSISLCFQETVALKIVSKFIGEDINELDATVTDAIGELTNISAGYAKKDLVEFKIEISLSTVVTGIGHKVFEPKDASTIIIPFRSPLGKLTRCVVLKDP